MKAAVLFGPRDLRWVARPIPRPGAAEVLIRVEACAICGSDLKLYNHPGPDHPPFGEYVMGHEFAGVVVALGATVDEFSVGERVALHVHKGCGRCENCLQGMYTACLNFGNTKKGHYAYGITANGGYAEFAVVHINNLFKLPPELSFEEATLATNAACGLYGLEVTGSYLTGATIAVMGPGPIGLMVVQICKAYGAKQVILVGTRETRLALGKQLGADYTIDIKQSDAVAEIGRITGGCGVDLAVEAAGNAVSFANCVAVARRGGKILLVGNFDEPGTIDLGKVVGEHLTLYGIRGEGGLACGRAITLLAQGKIKGIPLITHRFPLSEVNTAMQVFEARTGGAMKVILYPKE
jgi:L-iditol 2-dehydrogenase